MQRFRDSLQYRYGNVVRGWFEISHHESSVTFEQFSAGVKANGWLGEPLVLWRDMGKTHTESVVVTLEDFWPEASAQLRNLRAWMINTYGTLNKAWVQMLRHGHDPSHRASLGGLESQMDKYRFITLLETLQFPGQAGAVYNIIDYEHVGYITLRDLEVITQDPVLGGHIDVLRAGGLMQAMKLPIDKKEKAEASGAKKTAPATRAAGVKTTRWTVEGFRPVLEQKYGNLVRAWNTYGAMAKESMPFQKVADAMVADGFKGHAEPHGELYKALNCHKTGGQVWLEAFAPATYEALQGWLRFLIKQCGNLPAAWDSISTGGKFKTMGKYQFCEAMEGMNFEGNAAAIFGWLDVNKSGQLTKECLKAMPHIGEHHVGDHLTKAHEPHWHTHHRHAHSPFDIGERREAQR